MTLDEVADLQQEILGLHIELAAETLRADLGWQRYESANADRNALRTELMKEKERLGTIINLSVPLSVDGESVFIDGFGMVPLAYGKHRAYPVTPEEVIAFVGSHYDSMTESEDPSATRFQVSVHDLLSSFRDWQE